MNINLLCQKLRNGEYDGTDIMQTWIALEQLQSELTELKLINGNTWISVDTQLPSRDNGYVDELVLIRCKNKNKPDGIYLYDVCAFDGESWCERLHSYEDILDWKPIK